MHCDCLRAESGGALPQPPEGAALRYADDEGALEPVRPAPNLGPAPHDELNPFPTGQLPSFPEHEAPPLGLEERRPLNSLPRDPLVVGHEIPAALADLGEPCLVRG